jgi:hypothetical protein
MINKNIYDQNVEEIFIRKPTKKEKSGGSERSKGYNKIAPRENYEIIYKPYGFSGAGYYYKEVTEQTKT